MEVNCEGCAGCCLDWRPLAPAGTDLDHERRGPRAPLDDTYNLVPLSRDEVRGFVTDGFGDALTPRLWQAEGGEGVAVGGVEVAAVAGRPAFFVGLRKTPKPVAPFGTDPRWLETCAFLDPETLQCRIHGSDRYPGECASYPGHNLALDVETECERVEAVHGGDRLVEATPPGDGGPLLGPQALGAKVFAHPDPDGVDGAVARLVAGEATPADRAAFVAVAAASSPGTLAVNDAKRESAREAVLSADSWVGRACDHPAEAGDAGASASGKAITAVSAREERAGAPSTPGWDATREADGRGDRGPEGAGEKG
jgi:hypothetical protein